MRTAVYLHSPSEAPDASMVALRIPEFERYGERALLLARPGDVVCVADPVDERFLGFLASLGLGPRPEDVLRIAGVAPGVGLSARLVEDPASFDRLAERLRDAGEPTLVPFFASRASAGLARALGARLDRPVRVEGGPFPLVRRLHEKPVARALAQALRVPVAPGDLVRVPRPVRSGPRELAALRRAVERRAAPTGRAIVRGSSGASGSSTFVVEPDSLDALLDEVERRTDNDVYLVEPFFPAEVSPNVEVVVAWDRDAPLQAAATDQILDAALVYQGSRHPSRARYAPRMLADARRIARWMRAKGFRGRVGIDFLEPDDEDPRYFLCEINPRVNGASYPVALLRRLGARAAGLGAPEPRAFVARFVRVEPCEYRQVEERCGSLLYDARRGEGVVPHTTGALAFGKLGVACLAGSRPRAEEILDAFLARAGAERAAATAP